MPVKISDKRKSKRGETKSASKLKLYLFGTLYGLAVFLLGMILLSFVLMKTNSEVMPLYYISYIFAALGAFASAVFTQKRVGGRGFITGILSSVPYLLIIMIICFTSMKFIVSEKILLLIPICVLSGFFGGITAVNTR